MSQDTRTAPPWLEKMAQNRERTSYSLFALAAVVAVVPLWLLMQYRAAYLGVVISTLLLALVPAAAGLWNLLRLPGPEREIDITRMLTLLVGGLSGLLLVLTAAFLVYHWWDFFNGLKTIQGAESWRVWLALIVLLAGLGIMFASLQVARSEERTSVTLRRLVYGYNAVLTGILLLAILTVINVLAYARFKKPYDWTSQSIYSLSSRSENILQNLNKPTKIYAILPSEGETHRRVQALLDNCQAVNPKLEVEYLSPDLNRDRVKRLAEQYKVGQREGLLVLYGMAPSEESEFIALDTLYTGSTSSFSQSSDTRYFKGESELMTTISFLSQGKKQPVIYFTQGNGELDLNDMTARAPNVGLAALKRRLETDHYTVKGLQFTTLAGGPGPEGDIVSVTEVPKDATVVIVAGAKRALPPQAIKALRDYMEPTDKDTKTKGKLVVLFEQVLTPQRDGLVQTGLEDLLGRFNVQVGQDRILKWTRGDPLLLMATATPSRSTLDKNNIASIFEGVGLRFYDCRTVQPKVSPNPDDNRYRPDSFMSAIAYDAPIWVEANVRVSPEDWFREDRVPEVQKKVTRSASIGVTVTQEDPRGPHQTQAAEKTPRLVVLGTVWPVCNLAMRTPYQYDLVQSIVGWLRDRPADIGIEAKKQDVYTMNPGANINRMLGLPIFLMVFGIAGLGTAVWVVRRR